MEVPPQQSGAGVSSDSVSVVAGGEDEAKERPQEETGTGYVGMFERRVVRCARGDSSARDHLANERSYLAGLRTSLVVIGFGFGISEVSDSALFTGALFICLGSLFLLLAGHRYQSVSYHLQREEFIIDNLTASATVAITLLLALILLIFVFVGGAQRGVF